MIYQIFYFTAQFIFAFSTILGVRCFLDSKRILQNNPDTAPLLRGFRTNIDNRRESVFKGDYPADIKLLFSIFYTSLSLAGNSLGVLLLLCYFGSKSSIFVLLFYFIVLHPTPEGIDKKSTFKMLWRFILLPKVDP